MMTKPENRKAAINEEIRNLGGKPFSFKACPRILAMVVASDPVMRIGDASGYARIKQHEDVISQRVKGMSVDAKADSVELFLDAFSDGSLNGRPFARCADMAEGPMLKKE